ncbi:hypothetical protein [Streptomyces sp. NPDC058620]|uniref:hypothetical protein n=1 Tax=Streptomyces sp. NPDC058620 TaxID=3346560 RepID=UPI00364C0D38
MPKPSTPAWEPTAAWLQANGIDPSDVPLDSTPSEGVDSEGRPIIRYTVLLRRDGRRYLADDGLEAATEEREAPLITPRTAAPGPWAAGHQLTIRTQLESRVGPLYEATGDRWAEHRDTGRILVSCNCGFATGWTLAAAIPSLAELRREHEGNLI